MIELFLSVAVISAAIHFGYEFLFIDLFNVDGCCGFKIEK